MNGRLLLLVMPLLVAAIIMPITTTVHGFWWMFEDVELEGLSTKMSCVFLIDWF